MNHVKNVTRILERYKGGILSDQQQGAQPGSSPQPATTTEMIPKVRLDEVIAERNRVAQENAVLSQMLRTQVPSQAPRGPVEEPPHLKQLKEENPALYAHMKRQETQIKQQSATQFMLLDNQDRTAFLQEFGEIAREHLPLVEQKLAELRQQGIHHWNRGQILVNLKGQESLRAKPAPQTVVTTQQTQAPTFTTHEGMPGTNPAAASVASGGSAPGHKGTEESLEEKEKRLANEVF